MDNFFIAEVSLRCLKESLRRKETSIRDAEMFNLATILGGMIITDHLNGIEGPDEQQ